MLEFSDGTKGPFVDIDDGAPHRDTTNEALGEAEAIGYERLGCWQGRKSREVTAHRLSKELGQLLSLDCAGSVCVCVCLYSVRYL